MDFSLKLLDILIIAGIVQGIFLAFTLPRVATTNKEAMRILVYLILIASLMLIGRLWMLSFLTKWTFQYSLFFDSTLFLFGPLLLVYINRYLQDEQFSLSFAHYLPGILFSVISIYHFVRYTPDSYYEIYLQGSLNSFFLVSVLAAIISNCYYLLRSIRVVLNFNKQSKKYFSFDQSPGKYLSFFLIIISSIVLAWILGFINSNVFGKTIAILSYDWIWVMIPVFIYGIGYFSLKQQEIFRIKSATIDPLLRKDRLSNEDSKELQLKLNSLMEDDKIYMNNRLTLNDVAKALETSVNNVSWLLNNKYQTTFYDLINEYRVNEFVDKIENKEHIGKTILALSMEVGFNSKSTFNKAFKEKMNDTPRNFINQVH